MKICLVSQDYYPDVGGIEQHVYELRNQLIALGAQVWVVNLRTRNYPLPRVDRSDNVIRESFKVQKPWDYLAYQARLKEILESLHLKIDFDIIHWHDLIAGPTIRTWRKNHSHVPRVFTNHSSGYLRLREKQFGKLFLQYSLNHADLIIAPSKELFEKSQTDFKHPRKIQYIPNGFDELLFFPGNPDAKLLERYQIANQFVVLCPRRMAPKNGVFYLAKAIPKVVARHKNVVFLLTGKGEPIDEENRIRQQLARDGVESSVRFVGNVLHDDMPDLYRTADLVVMPSLMEAISLSALEAMATAKHIVASDVGGLSELFSSPNVGTLVPPASPNDLANAILRAIENQSQSIAIGNEARLKALGQYTWLHIARQTLEAYNEILNTKCQ